MMRREQALVNRIKHGHEILGESGNAFVEYFVAAAAMLAAVLAFYNAGSFGGIKGAAQGRFDSMVGQLQAGPSTGSPPSPGGRPPTGSPPNPGGPPPRR